MKVNVNVYKFMLGKEVLHTGTLKELESLTGYTYHCLNHAQRRGYKVAKKYHVIYSRNKIIEMEHPRSKITVAKITKEPYKTRNGVEMILHLNSNGVLMSTTFL